MSSYARVIKSSDLPAALLHAYVDSLEGWGLLEYELFLTWQFLTRAPNFDDAWDQFSRFSTSNQRERTIMLVEQHLRTTRRARGFPSVFARLVDLTKTRDRIVHGRWQKIEVEDDRGNPSEPEFIRIYDARGEPARPRNTKDEQRMLGRSRFYETELRDAQEQFRAAAHELFEARTRIIGVRMS